MRRNTLPGFAAGLIVLSAVLLGGCGGGGGGDSSSANANPPSSGTNGAPTISGSPSSSVVAGQAYSFQPSATDPNGDQLTFTVANLPGWATFNASTGSISGTPTASQVGAYSNITISVSDGKETSSLPAFKLRISGASTAFESVALSRPLASAIARTHKQAATAVFLDAVRLTKPHSAATE